MKSSFFLILSTIFFLACTSVPMDAPEESAHRIPAQEEGEDADGVSDACICAVQFRADALGEGSSEHIKVDAVETKLQVSQPNCRTLNDSSAAPVYFSCHPRQLSPKARRKFPFYILPEELPHRFEHYELRPLEIYWAPTVPRSQLLPQSESGS